MICCRFILKSYDYNKKILHHEYHHKMNSTNYNFIINDNEEITKLIVPCIDNYIRIWNFDSGEEIKEINIYSNYEDR